MFTTRLTAAYSLQYIQSGFTHKLFSLCVLLVLASLTACSTTPTSKTPTPKIHSHKPFHGEHMHAKVLKHNSQADVLAYLRDYQPDIYDVHEPCEGCAAIVFPPSFNLLIDILAQQDVIFVGEQHNRYEHHLNQLAILQALHQQQPKIAIGVEWFQQSFQSVLDQYLKGTLSETEFLRQSEYYERWRYDYRMMRPIIEYAKQHGLAMIALNAQSELIDKIRTQGLEGLSPEERAQLPKTIHPAPQKYREMLTSVFNQHMKMKQDKAEQDKALENFMLIQRTWDETMAMNGVRFLQQHPEYKLVVFAGNGHISNDVAIPADMQRELPQHNMLTVSTRTQKAKPEKPHGDPHPHTSPTEKPHNPFKASTEKSDEKAGVDYVILSEAVRLPKQGRLGVLLDQREDGLYVKDVMENGAAEKAGVEKGDRFIRIDSQDIATLTDLKLSLLQKAPQASVQLVLARPAKKGSIQQIDLTVTLK